MTTSQPPTTKTPPVVVETAPAVAFSYLRDLSSSSPFGALPQQTQTPNPFPSFPSPVTPTIARAQQTLVGFPAVAGPQRRTRAHHADVAAAAAALGIDEEDDGAAPSAAAAADEEEAEEEEEVIGEREASASNSLVPLQAPPAGLLFDGTPQTGGAAAAALIAAAAEASGLGPEHYVDITELLTLPQAEAAEKLHVPTSTLSKRWKEAARGRKWPHRAVAKLDKQILCLLHNIPQGSTAQHLPPEVEASLALLMRRRQEMLRPTVIRL